MILLAAAAASAILGSCEPESLNTLLWDTYLGANEKNIPKEMLDCTTAI